MEQSLLPIISEIEIYATKHNLNHRFVGGVSFGGLLNDETTYQIATKRKTVYLSRHNPLLITRDDGSAKDIDIILFCDDKEKIAAFNSFITTLKTTYRPCPLISVEPAVYPSLGKRNPLFQFVTALEVDEKNHLYLAFDSILQEISWQSVEPWRVVLENNASYTVRNPIADFYAYAFRSPSGLKPKDRTKYEYVKTLATAVYAEAAKHGINYYSSEYYKPWQHYLTKLENSHEIRILAKKLIMKVYWSTIGTWFAHGKGAAKVTNGLHNKFTGLKEKG